MTIENTETPEVKDDAEIAADPELETEETDPDSSPENDPEGDEPEGDDEVILPADPAPAAKKVEVPAKVPANELTRLTDETDREYAYRIEIKRLRDLNGKKRGMDVDNAPARAAKPAANDASKKILDKFKPEEIQNLREIFPVLAAEIGYVREGDLAAKQYTDIAQEQIDAFIKEHPEYSPENDPENILWGRLSQEYKDVYKQPENPKALKKIFDRIHQDIFGIQAKGPLAKTATAAAKEKIKVASHSGGAAPAARREGVQRGTTNLRLDMLKGFSEADKAAIEARNAE